MIQRKYAGPNINPIIGAPPITDATTMPAIAPREAAVVEGLAVVCAAVDVDARILVPTGVGSCKPS